MCFHTTPAAATMAGKHKPDSRWADMNTYFFSRAAQGRRLAWAFSVALWGGTTGLATSVWAQAPDHPVELYGLLDVGVTHVSGLAQGSATRLNSGIMEGSRWGLKGQENWGAGYQTLFTLESRFETDTGDLSNRPLTGATLPARLGTPAALGLPNALVGAVAAVNAGLGNTLGVNHLARNLFDRQAFVGVVTPVGAVLAGRQYTPAYEVLAAFDSMHTQSALAAGQLAAIPASIDIRLSNTLQYRLQHSGWTAALMLGAGETGTGNSAKRFTGAMAQYKTPTYALGLGYNARNNELGQRSLTNTTVGASVAWGPGTLNALYAANRDAHPSDLSHIPAQLGPVVGASTAQAVYQAYQRALQQHARLWHVGYRWPVGTNTFTVAYNALHDRTPANADARSWGAAVTHRLSPRTDLNLVLTRVDNTSRSQVAVGGNGYIGGVTRAPGVDSTSLAVGVRHRF